MPELNILRLSRVSIFEQLQIEEALLRADDRNWCLFNDGSHPSIVMGISGKVNELIDEVHFEKSPIPVIRRFSGGGTVVVDENTLFVSLICHQKAVEVPPFPRDILCWSGKLYHPLFNGESFCVRENDYVIGDRKIGGNAQYLSKERWIHHSTLLWDFCPERMNYLKMPPKMPEYRNERGHQEFLCCLKDFLGSREGFFEGIRESLKNHFIVYEATLSEMEAVLRHPHRKQTQKIC